jgi:hypothetical protein
MPDDRTLQERFFDGPLPHRMRLESALGGASRLRRAELCQRSRGLDRLALAVVLRRSAARRLGLAAAEAVTSGTASALARYRHAGLRCLARAERCGD